MGTLVKLMIALSLLLAGKYCPSHQFETMHSTRTSDYNHLSITRAAILNVIASYFEENALPRQSIEPGTLVNIRPLTASTLYKAYYGEEQASAVSLEDALSSITQGLMEVQTLKSDSAEAHFNGEQIREGHMYLVSTRKAIIDILNSTNPDYKLARKLTGKYLHTLQDFYSNTNWVENYPSRIYEDLGFPGKPLVPIAPPAMMTCMNCYDSDGTCAKNIIGEGGVLTSGYKSGQDTDKPLGVDRVGKCSHGGSTDESRLLTATGGINKESFDANKSPHHYLHETASQAAISATEAFFNLADQGLRYQVGDDIFRKFFNIKYNSGRSLCIVMDVTLSMGDDIAAAKAETVQIIEHRENTVNAPINYVLVPFSDPGVGPVLVTEDSAEYKRAVNALVAAGGGDCPELSISGLELGIQNSLPGSVCYVFTDADAKDAHKTDDMIGMAKDKQITVTYILTGSCRKKRDVSQQRRQLSHALRRRRRSLNVYERIAEATGGTVYQTTKDKIHQVTEIIDQSFNGAEVAILYREMTSIDSRSLSIPVDDSMSEFIIIVHSSTSPPRVQLKNPVGTLKNLNDGNIQTILDNQRSLMVLVKSPKFGNWMLEVLDNQPYTIEINGTSIFDFVYDFFTVEADGRVSAIFGRPIAEQLTAIFVTVTGLEEINSISTISLLDQTGDNILVKADLQKVSQESYIAIVVLPQQSFRVKLDGLDSTNNSVSRLRTAVVHPQFVQIRLSNGLIDTLYIDEKSHTNFTIINNGLPDVFHLAIVDNKGFAIGVTPSDVMLAEGGELLATFGMEVGSDAEIGSSSIVTLNVSGNLGSYNSIQLGFVIAERVIYEIDVIAPTCTIIGTDGNCTAQQQYAGKCSQHKYVIQAMATDAGKGLYKFSNVDTSDKTDAPPRLFEIGDNTAYLNYSSDCCTPRVVLRAVDIDGNFDDCVIDYTFDNTTVIDTTTDVVSQAITLSHDLAARLAIPFVVFDIFMVMGII